MCVHTSFVENVAVESLSELSGTSSSDRMQDIATCVLYMISATSHSHLQNGLVP